MALEGMANRSTPAGGGIFLAIGMTAGAGIGLYLGQASIGLLVGLAAGAAVALLMMFMGKRDS